MFFQLYSSAILGHKNPGLVGRSGQSINVVVRVQTGSEPDAFSNYKKFYPFLVIKTWILIRIQYLYPNSAKDILDPDLDEANP
jgi:hypothetical protein